MQDYQTQPGHAALREARNSLAGHTYFVTVNCKNREPLLLDTAAVAGCRMLWQLHREGHLLLCAWVLMPDHMHTLIQLPHGQSLAQTVGRMHSCVAKAANRAQHRVGKFWQGAYYDRQIRDERQLRNTVRYIINNPVKAGLVAQPGYYPFWNIVNHTLYTQTLNVS